MRTRAGKTTDPAQGTLFPAAGAEAVAETGAAGEADVAAGTLAVEGAGVFAERGAPELAQTLATLGDWAERGWIRRLDAALARFVAGIDPALAAPAAFAIAMTAHMEGRGHACLVVDELVREAARLLGWKPEPLAAFAAFQATMPGNPEDWIRALEACSGVCADERAPDSARPLVLRQGRLYLRRYRDYECRVATQLRRRASVAEPVDESLARPWLDRLFPADPARTGPDWQKVACALALRGRLTVITGGPGTGKTYTAARLLTLLFALAPNDRPLRFALAAPTGKAAARLKQSIDSALADMQKALGDALALDALTALLGPARTLHALLGARPDTRRFRHDASDPLEVDVLVVDEASMVHLEMMAALLDALPENARIVLLGDKDQLASVEAGAVLGELCRDAERVRYTAETCRYIAAVAGCEVPASYRDETGPPLAQHTVTLRQSQRFGGDIGALAQAANAGDVAAARDLLRDHGDGPVLWMPSASPAAVVDLALPGRTAASRGYRSYLEAIAARTSAASAQDTAAWAGRVLSELDRFRVLCAVREGDWGVAGLNQAIEKRLRSEGLIPDGSEWYEGRPVIVTRNDRALGVYNGDMGVVLRPTPGAATLRAYFVDGATVRSVAVSRLADVETAFAMTVHKSQGSEFSHTVLVLPAEPGLVTSRELIYTGITRARSALTLVAKTPEAFFEGIATSARRSSGLYGLLLERS